MEEDKKRGRGRPKTETPMVMNCLRTLPDEWELWAQAAEVRGLKLSAYIRQTMNRSAKRPFKPKD